ncbi:Putative immunogloblin [Archangium gephyra]|uniref:Immunogloblin n=1 Tax=Archangium gephyra TaxID=48 RepID=A0AAC8Q7Q1_9BACT|nr:Putative immunogloblin [Archangium gephyra]
MVMLLAAGAASAGTPVQGALVGDTTWTAAGSPYTMTGDVTVPSWATLTIEPGVQVIANTSDAMSSGLDTTLVELIVQGNLQVQGTDIAPVTFKATTAGSGRWRGIRVEAGTLTTLAGALIRDATYGLDVTNSGTSAILGTSTLSGNSTGAYVRSSGTLVMYQTVSHANTNYGVQVSSGTANLRYNTVVSNNSYGVYVSSTAGNLSLQNSIVSSNGNTGVYRFVSGTSTGTVTLSHNDVWNNVSGDYSGVTADANSFSANPLFVSTSTASPNFRLTSLSPARKAASDKISDLGALPYAGDVSPVLAGSIHENTTLSGAYTLSGDLTIPTGVTVTVAPGTTFTVATSDVLQSGLDTGLVELIARGSLQVLGTDSSPVTFKAATAGSGRWRGIRVEAGTTTALSGALIRDATYGLDVTNSGTTASLSSSTLTGNSTGAYVRSSGTLVMDHTVSHANTNYGVQVSSGTANLQYDTVVANSSYGVYVSSTAGSLSLQNSIVSSNGNTGVYRFISGTSTGTVTLSHNDVWNNVSGDYSGVTADANSFSANPLFVSTSTASPNFRLTSLSPARKAASDKSSDIGALPYAGDVTPILAGAIHENTTLSGAYTLSGDLTIPTGVTVTVAPGTTFTVATSDVLQSGLDTGLVELIARGSLQVLGTDSSPVTFKAATAGSGKWRGIRVEAGTTTALSGALIRDATYGLDVTNSGTTASLSSSTLTGNSTGAYVRSSGTLVMDHTVSHANTNYGVQVSNGTANLQYNTVVANSSYGVYVSSTAGSLSLQNSIVSSNGNTGVYRFISGTSTGTVSLSHNDVWNNVSGDYSGVTADANSFSANPLFVSSSNFRLTSYSPARKAASDKSSDIGALPYTGDVTPILAGAIHENTTLSGAYTLSGDLTIPTGVTVTVAPGTTFTVATSDVLQSGLDTGLVELIARGSLQVLGTDSSPVTFKAATAGSGRWRGIRVEAGTTTALSGALIRDATYGLDVTNSGTTASLSSSTLTGNSTGAYVRSSGTLVMDHTVSHANTNYGVQVSSGTANLQYDTVVANSSYGVYVSSTAGSLSLQNSIVSSNGNTGVYRFISGTSTGTVTLSHNDVWNNVSGDYSGVTADANSFSANPLFVSTSTASPNFRLTSLSPARKAASDKSSDIGALPYAGDVTPILAGAIHENTTLSGAYTLSGDLTIPTGVTVTVAPGTTFTVSTSDALQSGLDTGLVELIARGSLQVLGTDSSPVTFKAATAGSGRWRGIRVEAGTTTALSGALIRDATYGLDVTNSGTTASLSSSTLTGNSTGAYVRSNGTLAMDHTVSHANTNYGVQVSSGTANLQYNTVVSNNSYGVYVSSTAGSLSLQNSIVSSNGNTGVYRFISGTSTGTVTLSHNDVWNNVSSDYSGVTAGPSSISANPLFVSSSDFHLQATSPCRRISTAGTDIGALPYDERTVTSVQIVPASTTVDASGTTAFIARAYNSEGNPISDVAFTWSARSAAGTIDGNGVLTASCTPATITSAVTATSPNGVSASANVTIVPGPAAQVIVSPAATGIEAGASRLFLTTVKDRCGNIRTGDTIDWSTAPGTGTITSAGQYTATCSPGNYTGAVSARVGAVSGTANVFVSTGPLAKIVLSPLSPKLAKGGSQTFSATPTDSCGNTRTDTVSWAVVNGGGTISTSGVFTAGTAPGFYANTIQATAGSKVAQTDVTVLGGEVASLELSPSAPTVAPKGTVTFTVIARDELGNEVPADPTWSVVSGGGTIDASGVFTAGTVAGTYANTVRVVAGSASATATVTVVPGPADRIELSPSPALLAPGGTVRFTARVLDVHGNVRTDEVTWSLMSSLAGTLDSKTGDFTASTLAGTYTDVIRAEAAGRTALATVTIKPGALARLELSPLSASLGVGESVTFTVRGQDEYGNEVTLLPTWEILSGGGTINAGGTFTAGTVAGTYTDTVRVSAGGMSALATVVVKPGPVVSVSLAPGSPSLPTRGTVQFTATATDAFGNELATSPRGWSAHPSAGTITGTGLFTAGNVPGFYSDAIQVEVEGVKATTSVELSRRVARVEVSSTSASALPAGGSATFTARAFDSTGAEVSEVAFTWSALTSAGSIDSSGRLSVACSRATVPAAVTATAEGISGSVDVTIVAGPAASLALSPASVTLAAKGSTPFTASAEDRCGNALPPPSVTWSTVSGAGSINPAGQYTAPCSVGSLPSAVMAQLGSLSATANVTVTPGALATLSLSPASAEVAVTGTKQFSVVGADTCGNALTPAVSWEVVSGGGSVNGTGLFTAGTTAGSYADTLRVSASGVSASASLTVLPGPLASLSVTPARVELLPAGTVTFTAQGADSFGNPLPVSADWSVVAGGGGILPSGAFTAGSTAGTYTDTVRAAVPGFTASATVVVQSGSVSRLELMPTEVTLEPGQVRRFTAQAFDVFGNRVDAPLTWSVATPEVGTIDGDGSFTAGTVAGSYPEAVRVSTGGITAVAQVLVVAGPTARVELSPLAPEVRTGGTVRFTARALDAHGNQRSGVPAWTARPEAGSITSEGVFTASSVAGDYATAVTGTIDGVSASTSVKVLSSGGTDGGDGGTDGGDGGQHVPDPGGCGCSSAADASAPLMALLVLALGATRRRRSRA